MSTWYHNVGLLVLRVLSGLGMATHGYGKIFAEGRIEQFAEGVEAMGFPAPLLFAWLAALSEFVGGLFLAAGFLTRYAALLIFGTMTVAAFIAHSGDPFSERELALLYWTVSLAIIFLGAGQYAVDALLKKNR